MAVNSTGSSTSYSSRMRISGLSGLDTDSIVSQLMQAESGKVDKVKQKRQLLEWKSDSYREMTTLLKGFKDDFFDILNPSTNVSSQSNYKKFSVASSDNTVVTATGSTNSTAGTHTITVSKVATATVNKSSATVTKGISGSGTADYTSAQGKSFYLTVDGTKKTISIDSTVTGLSDLQGVIDAAFGVDKVVVSENSGKLSFASKAGSGVNKLELSATSSSALVDLGFSSTDNLSNRLSVSSSLETLASKMNTSFTFNSSDDISITFNKGTSNEKTFAFDKSTTLSSMMNQINSDSTAGVLFQYDEVNDVFKITSKQTGEGTNISISETGSSFLKGINLKGVTGTSNASAALKDFSSAKEYFSAVIDGKRKNIELDGNYTTYSELTTAIQSKIETAFGISGVSVSESGGILSISSGESNLSIGEPITGTSALASLGLTSNYIDGVDAEVILDGQTLTRSSNKFEVDGVSYSLLKKSSTEQSITLSQDIDSIYNTIKGFVNKYNDVLSKLNAKLDEEYDRDYQPLTDSQKEEMTEEEIASWEKKAKTGLLRNDNLLQGIAYTMRNAMNDAISGVGINLSSIGISAASYEDKGKLTIDETKLKEAIQNDPDSVMNLFTKSSDVSWSRTLTSAQKTTRYQNEGIANRISDVLNNYISTYRDSDGRKGLLLEKAGMEGDASEYTNALYNQIYDYDTRISTMLDQLEEKEDRYYEKYSALETQLAKMQSQSDWLASQLGSSNS